MKLGGQSDPRNKALMKMFNLIDIGERAGSGVPELFTVWENEDWEEPRIEEQLDNVERTTVILSFKKKSAEKKVNKKTLEQYEVILSAMKPDTWYQAKEFCDLLGVKDSRTRELFRGLTAAGRIEDDGATKGKRYRLKGG